MKSKCVLRRSYVFCFLFKTWDVKVQRKTMNQDGVQTRANFHQQVHVKFKKGEPTVQQQTGGSQKIFKSEWGAGIIDVQADGKVRRMSSLERISRGLSSRLCPEDIKGLLPVIQQRKLLEAFRLETEIITLDLQECGRATVEYFRTQLNHRDVQTVVSQGLEGDLTFHVVKLLLAHFGESPEGLMILADVSSTSSDIERKFTLPTSPRFILLGNQPMTNCQWMISIEGHVVCEGTQPTFASGLAALFAVFYVFNLQYQDEASKTLEFIQRRFFSINPERRSKTTHGKVVSKRIRKAHHQKTKKNTRIQAVAEAKWVVIIDLVQPVETTSTRKRIRRMKSKERKKKHNCQIFPKIQGRPQHNCKDCFYFRAFPCHTRDTQPAL
ncbi:hypothetical protein AOLI_G00228940 [Acnodon oligacanthus]